MLNNNTITVILAGGVGSRLHPLTGDRAKPAVPFGGKYRIIDFALTNCLHSGLRRILILTQYKSHSLQKHIRDGWSILNPELGEYITLVPPQMRTGTDWYSGTADAIYQNLYLLKRSGAKNVIILPGDHIYRMDYAPLVEAHENSEAFLTIACMNVPIEEAHHFGIVSLDEQQQVIGFHEKPTHAQPLIDNSNYALASMGVYVFNMDYLVDALEQDHSLDRSSHDFGNDIIPRLIDDQKVYGYHFGGANGRVTPDNYWRDVGTVDAYYQTNMDLLKEIPPMDLYQSDWPVRTYSAQYPPARTVPGVYGSEGIAINSIIANGTVIAGGSAQHSILFNNVFLDDEANVQNSLLLDGVKVGKGSQLNNCIVDKYVTIPDGETIGYDLEKDKARFTVSTNGIVVISKDHVF